MQSLCTFTTSSDTFCTAVNEKKNANTMGRRVGGAGACGPAVGERRGAEEVR